jgi:hypothetical protein
LTALLVLTINDLYYFILDILGFLCYNIQNTILERLLILAESILLPGVVREFGVKAVSIHAFVEQAQHEFVVGVLVELQTATVLHELLEFGGLALAQFIQRCLHLLLFYVAVLLVFAPPGKTLPWQTALQKIEQHMADRF